MARGSFTLTFDQGSATEGRDSSVTMSDDQVESAR